MCFLRRFSSLIVFIFLLSSPLACFDMPHFFRTSHFQGTPKKDLRNNSVYLEARYSEGDTRHGFDKNGSITNALNIWGPIDVNRLGNNLENITSKPLTNAAFGSGGSVPTFNFTTTNDGVIEVNGEVKIREWNFEIHKNFFSGFFINALLPYRVDSTHSVTIINRTNVSHASATSFQNFINNDLDPVLQENGLAPLTTPFNKSHFGDLAVYVGWQGYDNGDYGVTKDINGSISAGIIVPIPDHEEIDRVITLPLGYRKHWGLGAKGVAEGHVSDSVALGAAGSVTVFLQKTRRLRMKTDRLQSGILLLESGVAEIEPGSVWNIGGYVKLDQFIGGLSIITGASFSGQEKTFLEVKDNRFLNTFIQNEAADSNVSPKSNKSNIVNTDQRFKSWYQGVAHILVQYDFKAHGSSNLLPKIEGFYNVPLLGEQTFRIGTFGAAATLNFTWDF